FSPGVGDIPATPGIHEIDLREAIRQRPEVHRLNVLVMEADPPSVRILVETADTLTIPRVPVWISMPAGEYERWSVEAVDPFVENVVVKGPRESIASVRDDPGRIVATVVLSADDLERRATSGRVVFTGVPQGVAVSGKAGEAPLVRL